MARLLAPAVLLAVSVTTAVGCSFKWDDYDPRLAGEGGAASQSTSSASMSATSGSAHTSSGSATTSTGPATGSSAMSSSSSGMVLCNGPQDCTALDDACNAGACVNGVCAAMPANEGQACPAADMCTTAATCKAGACSGAPVDCSGVADACNAGSCDPQKGCVKTPANDGGQCDDGQFCTTGDVCAAGSCSGAPRNCPGTGNPCFNAACDENQKSCVNVPGNDGAACDDGIACTVNTTCSNGGCGNGQQVNACSGGDGCCPGGCNVGNDSDCQGTCGTNVALGAAASTSGGGVAMYGPQNMNDQVGPLCTQFAWVSDNTNPAGQWIELDWGSPVGIGSFYIETDNGLAPACGFAGRNIASGNVQYWDGANFIDAGSFSGQHGNIQFNVNPPVSTTRLRVFNVTTDPGNGNSIIFEWHVYSGQNCSPPP